MTRRIGLFVPLAVFVALAAFAAVAHADPTFDAVDSEVSRARKLTITVESTFGEAGELRVEGTVNGREVNLRKRVRRAGSRRVRFRIDAKRYKLRRIAEPLTFDLNVVAEEAAGARIVQPVRASVPVPVVFLPGLGNETTPELYQLALLALDGATNGAHVTDGKRPTLVLHTYPSLEKPLPKLGKLLHRTVKRTLKGTAFGQVDIVAHSLGGLVTRDWMKKKGRGRARNVVFLGTPNEGAPLAQLLGLGLQTGQLTDVLGGDLLPDLGGGLGQFTDALNGLGDQGQLEDVLRMFYPTYEWAFITIDIPILGEQTLAVTPELIDQFGAFLPDGLGDIDLSSPLTELAAFGPDPNATFWGLGFTSVIDTGEGPAIGTVDEVDLSFVLTGGEIDPFALADGEGDGLVPFRSVIMDDTPNWRDAITPVDLGAGNHFALLTDPAVLARVGEILAGE